MPQLSKTELDRAFKRASKGDTPVEIHEKLMKTRKSRGELGPDLTSVRRALRGETHQRGRKETRGVKKKLTPYNPNSYRSRLPVASVVMPYKNSSQLVIGDRTSHNKNHFKTVNQQRILRPDYQKSVTNPGISSREVQWLHKR